MVPFKTAGGSVTGLDHVYAGRSNQDAWTVRNAYSHMFGSDALVVVVADGCSDGAHTEVGAHFGTKCLADVVVNGRPHINCWEGMRLDVLRLVDSAVMHMGGMFTPSRRAILNDYWLFTLVVAVITPEYAEFAAIGDGYLEVNGETIDLGTFERNEPPYLAYALTETKLAPEALFFRVLKSMPTEELQNFIIGTDGVRDLAVLFPDEASDIKASIGDLTFVDMTDEDWVTFFQQTDQLNVQAVDGSNEKIILRKSARSVDNTVSWAVYRRDGYACRYCGNDKVPLTVDHLVRWEERGPWIEQNLVSACRRCNKTRGDMSYADWLRDPYYGRVSQKLKPEVRAANEALTATLDTVPRVRSMRSR